MQGKHAICVHDVPGYGLTEEATREMEKELIRSSSLYPPEGPEHEGRVEPRRNARPHPLPQARQRPVRNSVALATA
jgi:hypothetical protein